MYRRMREMWATSAMQIVVVGDEWYQGTDAVATDEEIHAHIKKSLKTVWHAAYMVAEKIAADIINGE
ncbi:putative choline dehydrogenase [Diplodia seriata]|uniref:Putative choline dehydrogenase n=1 Tax=Diplodia seriata TaxID=420778 RepID=A0A0G2DUJ9_9PEZI|nr:putative choline dehydrogenase [Diplodia seriata]